MPYITNRGVRIHYEVLGTGPPLVMLHGFTGSLSRWEQLGYVDVLQRQRQLVMLDARGHGTSDKPYEPAAYTLERHSSDVVSVLDTLKVPKADFFGYSMGGWIGFGMAKFAPERLHSLILGAAHPFRDDSWEAFRNVDATDSDAFIRAFESVLEEQIPDIAKPIVLANDLRALLAAAQPRPSFEEILPRIGLPTFLFVGDLDSRLHLVKECTKRIKDATFASVPGANHVTSLLRSDLSLPNIKAFLDHLRGIEQGFAPKTCP